MTNEQATAENLEGWDRLAPLHARGSGAAFYRIEEWLAGETKLAPWEIEELGPVTGKRLLHLQCHIGTDTLSWARLGAIVTGLDYSPAALREAERFARVLEIPTARFVESTVQAAPEILAGETFDVLYTGRGALCWLPDLNEWARVCRTLVQPGGVLYLEESHPTLNLLDEIETEKGKLLVPKYSPFQTQPTSETCEGTYADREAETGPITTHSWEYRLDTLINALQSNGFRLDFLHERPECFYQPWSDDLMESIAPNLWRLKAELPAIPLSFTLRATRLD